MQADPQSLNPLLPEGLFLFCILAFLVFLAILWTLLPFAIFGLKRRLDGVNQRLDILAEILRRPQVEAPLRQPSEPPTPSPDEGSPWSGFSSTR